MPDSIILELSYEDAQWIKRLAEKEMHYLCAHRIDLADNPVRKDELDQTNLDCQRARRLSSRLFALTVYT